MPEIKLRSAVLSDSADILSWRNDADTVKASFSSKRISPDEHEQWFIRSLNDPRRRLFIAETEKGEKIGLLRFDLLSEQIAEVSINLAPAMRGKGYGATILARGSRLVKGMSLIARAKSSNPASVKIFEKAGYSRLFSYEDVNQGFVQVLGASAE